MSMSMYQASVPVFVRTFNSLSAILDKAVAFAAAEGIDPATLIAARLVPDMRPLTAQVQIASDSAKGAVARLAGIEPPAFADDEASFDELQARIAKTLAFLATVTPDQVDGSEARPIVLKIGGEDITLVGQPFLLHFAVPNFFFHVTTAYAILRHSGVPLGKMDYLGGI